MKTATDILKQKILDTEEDHTTGITREEVLCIQAKLESLHRELVEAVNKQTAKPDYTDVFAANRTGWFCTLLHDFPEPEGVVWFSEIPKQGQRFMLPSSDFTDEWEVKAVCPEELTFTAVKPKRG